MYKKVLYFLFLLVFSLTSYAQDTIKKVSKVQLRGRVTSITDKKPLESAHILNLNSVEGTITNSKGLFSIPAVANDTILISYIGFQSIKLKITNDLL